MPRYNSTSPTAIISGASTIGSPYTGAFTGLTGTAPYTVTLPNPALFPGANQTFYNATAGTITLNTPDGLFSGLGGSGTSNQSIPTNTVVSVTSDGTNYVVLSEDGSVLYASDATITGNLTANGSTVAITPQTLTLSSTSVGTLNNVNIGGSTRGSGAFTTIQANSQVNFTANVTSSNTTSGTLVVTGGVGVSGNINAASVVASTLTGTLQTAAQTNITSVGTLTGLNVTNSTSNVANFTSTGSYIRPVISTTGTTGNLETSLHFSQADSGSGKNYYMGIYAPTSGFQRMYFDNRTALSTSFEVNGSPVLTISNGGNVAINRGTTLATRRLDVNGDVRISGSLYRPDDAGVAATFGDGTNTLYGGTHAFQNAVGNTNLLTVNATGLGVGVSPSYKLHVPGRSWINDGSAADTQTRALGLTVSVNPGANYSPGSDPGDGARAVSIISGVNSGYPAILGFRNIAGGSNQQMVDLVLDPNSNKFYLSRPSFTPWLSISNTTHDITTSRGFRNWTKSHSTTNGSAGGGSPTTTNITQIGDNMFEYSFYFFASTGGYPTCPNSYWVVCPLQKQNTGSLGWAEVEIRGVHRGMWGTSYDEYANIIVGTGSDGGGIYVKEWKNGDANNSSNRMRVGWINYDGAYNEGNNYNTGYNLASWTGNTIGNNYYKMPLLIKIYTNCGADKEYYFTIRTTNPDVLGPPFKGPMWLAPNTNPTTSIYW